MLRLPFNHLLESAWRFNHCHENSNHGFSISFFPEEHIAVEQAFEDVVIAERLAVEGWPLADDVGNGMATKMGLQNFEV